MQQILSRVYGSVRMSILGGPNEDTAAWHGIRNAVYRAILREMKKNGFVAEEKKQSIFNVACDYASATACFRGWDSTFENANEEILLPWLQNNLGMEQ